MIEYKLDHAPDHYDGYDFKTSEDINSFVQFHMKFYDNIYQNIRSFGSLSE